MTDYVKRVASRLPVIPNEWRSRSEAKTEAGKKMVLAPEGYRKEAPILSPALFIIVSGGEKREKDYFSPLMRRSSFPRIQIVFIEKNAKGIAGLPPQKMLYEALRKKTCSRMEHSYDEDDKYYLVADVDDFVQELRSVHKVCRMQGLHLVISNPCFEVWLYYSKWKTKPDFVRPKDPLKTSQDFKYYLGTKGGVDPRKAIYSVKENIANAKLNFEKDDEVFPQFLSTNMFELMENILPFVEQELWNVVEARKRKEEEYREKALPAGEAGAEE